MFHLMYQSTFKCLLFKWNRLSYVYWEVQMCTRIHCNKMYNGEQHEIWNPCENLIAKYKNANYAIVILNTYFKFHSGFLLNLWNQAKVRVTVDGGTERWLSWLKLNNLEFSEISPPDLITGDMDSLSKDILDYILKKQICRVVKTPDQNETDFTKSLRELSKFCASESIEIDVVYVIADTSGRFDQILANINTLYKVPSILRKISVFLVASDSVTWLLREGNHTISIPLNLRQNHEWCALIPVSGPSYITTSGLKWNLDKSKLEFGGLVSTSNTYDGISSKVTIHTDSSIVWSMGIESLLETIVT